MTNFAKIFQVSPYGQILVLLDENDEGEPALKVSVKPEGWGVCSTQISFPDTDEGWENAETAFKRSDEAFAANIAKAICNATGGDK